ncbi:alpha/beta fold hydrolase [Bosea sp. (in: a-proteobacteria)]|uniref:alpha/beta fold hydrolase n=1 Tax=Bosea sp. (in: a-proteobacteria) TaxID=1871050 RepID=UPI0027346E97|nr:alpha/beta fold hydrolase [Bosea sp. (in: a-proteobacteria)]MDP3256998.1 alpha/beta fold hydrolase [Bosea sp. (in: a-proteobacteria)]
MTLHFVRHGEGPRLLLVHGLGGTWRSWSTILPALSKAREVTAIDLPGHGETPAAADSGTFAGLADSVERFVLEQELDGIDIVGSSLGARIVLEMARRGRVGATVALDPGGFWRGWERTYFRTTLAASIRLLRGLRPALPRLSWSAVIRSALLAQLSARPWRLDEEVVAAELQSFASTKTFDALVRDLATGSSKKVQRLIPLILSSSAGAVKTVCVCRDRPLALTRLSHPPSSTGSPNAGTSRCGTAQTRRCNSSSRQRGSASSQSPRRDAPRPDIEVLSKT